MPFSPISVTKPNKSGLNRFASLLVLAASAFAVACSSGGGSDDIGDTTGTLVPASEQRLIANTGVRAYKANGKYAAVLKNCIVDPVESCTLAELPYIGQEHPSPSIANIMDRVLVSHDWMGIRFEQILSVMPPETRVLFEPLTAIIIGSEVRPSNYRRALGRISLDPRHLWLSNSEKITVSTQRDFRDGYGQALKFGTTWRMVKDNQYAWFGYSLTDDTERKLKDIILPMSRLLYHELGHAVDFMPPGSFDILDGTDTPLTAVEKVDEDSIADRLFVESLGLTVNNSPLYPLARTLYRDDEAPADYVNYSGLDVGTLMGEQGKTTFYAYNNRREDVATLFEHAMMRRYHGLETHLAFYDKPADEDNAPCTDYLISWGVTNRIAAPLVSVRAEWVMNEMLGESAAVGGFFQRVGTEGTLPMGVAWCESLESSVSGVRSRDDVPTMKELMALERELFQAHNW